MFEIVCYVCLRLYVMYVLGCMRCMFEVVCDVCLRLYVMYV